MQQIRNLQEQMVETCRLAYASKLVAGTSGNLSLHLPQEGLMLITPSSMRYNTMQPQDIVVMQLDGTVVQGAHAPSSEWPMHAALFQACPESTVVFHTHSPYATAFATVRKDIPVILIEMTPFLGGSILCTPFAQPGTAQLGHSAATALAQGRTGCLLASHGVLTVGRSLDEACIRAEYIEEAALIYHHALQIGTPVNLAPNSN